MPKEPKHPSATVAAGWAAFNTVLALITIAYHESAFGTVLYLASTGIAWLAALLALVSSRVGYEEQPDYAAVAGTGLAALPAVLVGVAAMLAAIYSAWLVVLAVPPLAVAITLAVREHRARAR